MSGFPPPDPTTADHDLGLHHRLGALAATLPPSPDRVAGVAARARRRHRRQAALRSGAALACAGAVVGGLLAVRAGHPSGDRAVGAADTTATTPATTAPVNLAIDCPPPPPVDATGSSGKGGAEVGISVSGVAGENAGTTTQLKAIGTVTAVDDASITVAPDKALPDGTASITASITDATEFYDNGSALAERPTLAAGDRVVIGVRTDAGAAPVVEFVTIHADDPVPVKVGDGQVIKGADGSVVIHVGDGSGSIDGSLSVATGDGKVTCVVAGGSGVGGAPVEVNVKA